MRPETYPDIRWHTRSLRIDADGVSQGCYRWELPQVLIIYKSEFVCSKPIKYSSSLLAHFFHPANPLKHLCHFGGRYLTTTASRPKRNAEKDNYGRDMLRSKAIVCFHCF